MKGIVLAGGNGRRLDPLTQVTNKHLLPVYESPMIFYPLATLIKSGIKEILVIANSRNAHQFQKFLNNHWLHDAIFSYAIQENQNVD